MLPYFNQLRAAALNLQLGGAGGPEPSAGGPGPPPVSGPPGFPFPAPFGPDPLLGLRFPAPGRFVAEEPKPQHSYIGLIAMAILSSPEHKMVLSDIYQWILDNYPYFRTRGPGWRNSIRHNLSLNDCFVKSGRSANGKGHYWAIHPANMEDFRKGDFRRRRAQRKVRKHMGLSVPDEDDDSDDSPAPTPLPGPGHPFLPAHHPFAGLNGLGLLMRQEAEAKELRALTENLLKAQASAAHSTGSNDSQVSPSNSSEGSSASPSSGPAAAKKGRFDMESLLAPDRPALLPPPPPFHPALLGFPAFQAGLWQLGGGLPATSTEGGGSASPPGPDRNDAAQWQETFAKIMARSYAAKRAAAALASPSPAPH